MTHRLFCPDCKDRHGRARFVGTCPEAAFVTGTVDFVPHPSVFYNGACGYMQCVKCHKFVRYEFLPPGVNLALAQQRSAA